MTAEVSSRLSLAVDTFRRMTNRRWEGSDCVGNIALTFDNCQLLNSLEAEGLIYPLGAHQLDHPSTDQSIEIQLQPSRGKSGFFAIDFDDLLAQAGYSYAPPESFYLSDLDELFPDSSSTPSDLLQGYLNTIQLSNLLRSIADHEDASGGCLKLVFLLKEKIDIPITYSIQKAKLMVNVSELETLLSEDVHRDQRRTIFKNILLEELKTVMVEERFGLIIERFGDIYRRFRDNYQLYVSEFSFDKVIKEVSDKRLEYVLKFNKNFSDIQNQILAVPLAALLAASQMGRDSHLKNLLIFVTALIFSGFMSMLLRNQRVSLNAIKKEIDDQRASLDKDHTALAPRFESTYLELDKRFTGHNQLISVVDLAISVILVLVPDILFMYYTVVPLFWV